MQIICRLFGSPAVFIDDRRIQFPYKKAGALFYYLLSVSDARRQELSSLLWPELSEVSAKKNLRNALYKIKEAFEGEEILKIEKSSVKINPDIDIVFDADSENIFSAEKISSNRNTSLVQKISSGPNTPLDENISSRENNFLGEDISGEEFLKDFSVKNSASFEQWLNSKREYYRQLYIDDLKNRADRYEKDKDWKMMEKCCKSLIEIDEFDEKAYAGLIKSYINQRMYDKGINTYKKLEKLLRDELGIKPGSYIKDIFNFLLDEMDMNKTKLRDEEIFFDRYSELRIIEKAYEEFRASGISNAVIVSGERGSGKTALIEKFLSKIEPEDFNGNTPDNKKQEDISTTDKKNIRESNSSKKESIREFFTFENKEKYGINNPNIPKDSVYKSKKISIMKLICLKDEINQPFRAWKTLIVQKMQQRNLTEKSVSFLSNTKSIGDTITDAVISFLFMDRTSESYLLYIDDIQFMDEESLSLLGSLMTNFSNIMLVAACDNSMIGTVKTRLSRSQSKENIRIIDLKRWNIDDIFRIIKEFLQEKEQSLINPEHMLYNTRGIAVFVKEYINQIKQGNNPQILSGWIKSYLSHMISDISKEERLVLEATSFFSEDADFDMLRLITEIENEKLSYSIDSLCKKGFLLEKDRIKDENLFPEITYIFNYQGLSEYVYSGISITRRRTVHKKIAQALEEKIMQMPSNMALYHRLIFHFIKANDKRKALDYSVRSLNRYLNYSHELFPILFEEDQALLNSGYISRSATTEYLDDIEKLLMQVKKEGLIKEYKISLIAFLHMKGRYLIREANYEEGTRLIKEMIERSLEINDDDYTLEGYKQMIYYCIQTADADLMQNYIRLALDIAIKHNYHKETGIILRFNGLYHMLREEYEKAEQMLQSSVGTFTISDEVADKYALNIAAAYNYIGEVKRLLGHHKKAGEYYQKAIDIGLSKEAVTSLMVFYINAGQNEYQSGDHTAALEYFKKAETCKAGADIHWKKSILNAYTGLLEIENVLSENGDNMKSYEKAIERIKEANKQALKMRNPQEIRTAAWSLERAQYLINRKK